MNGNIFSLRYLLTHQDDPVVSQTSDSDIMLICKTLKWKQTILFYESIFKHLKEAADAGQSRVQYDYIISALRHKIWE